MELDSAKINELRFLLVNYAEPESVVRHAGSKRGNKNAFVMIKRLGWLVDVPFKARALLSAR